MKNRAIIPILIIGLVVATVWGYSQYQAKRQWEISTENQYQRASEELATHVNNMEAEMSKTLVAASFPQMIQLLTNTWRDANSCQEDLGQLPLTSMELKGTKQLLANVSTFCFNTAQERLIKGTKISEDDWKRLKLLRDRTRILARHLSDVQQNFYTNRSRWLEVDRMAFGAAGMTQMSNNKVTKAFIMLEDGLQRAPDIDYVGNNLDFSPKPTGLTGKNVSIKEAEVIAKRFIAPDHPGAKVKYERLIRGGFPSYMIRVQDPKGLEKEMRVSVSVKGGHIAWMLGSRNVNQAKLSLDSAGAKATEFLNRNGYTNMKVVANESFDNIATVSCVSERNKVLYYPELVKVQVAQDNGDVLGCDFIPYLTFHDSKNTKNPAPKLEEERIKKLVNPHLNPKDIRLAQVLDEMYNKVLCYEVAGTQGSDHFLIYYNANTGKEEKIRRVDRYGNEII